MSVATDDADIVCGDALDFPPRGHHDQFVIVIDSHGADDRTIAFGGLDVDDPFATASLGAIARRGTVFIVGCIVTGGLCRFGLTGIGRLSIGGLWRLSSRIDRVVIEARIVFFDDQFIAWPETCTFAVTVLAHSQQGCRRIGDDHTDNFVLLLERNPFDSRGVSPHRPGVVLAESDGHSPCGRQDDLVFGFGDHHIDQLVIFAELDRDDASFLGPAVGFQRCLFDDSFFGDHHQEVAWQVEIAHRNAVADFLFWG